MQIANVNPDPVPIQNMEFGYIPVSMVTAASQVRREIDQGSEAFVALKTSIAEKGVLEPILVVQDGGEYRLVSGERRLLACRALNMETIPARILANVFEELDVTAIQLIENLLREDLNPIDQAHAILAYFQGRQPLELDQAISQLILWSRDPMRVDGDIAETVAKISTYTGKSASSTRNLLSLLKLPEAVQQALGKGDLPLSQGYLFVEYLDHPKLLEIFRMVLATPMTNATLRNFFIRMKEAAPASGKKPIARLQLSLRNCRKGIENGLKDLEEPEVETLLTDLRSLVSYLETYQTTTALLETPAETEEDEGERSTEIEETETSPEAPPTTPEP